jgi:hypothetical protein
VLRQQFRLGPAGEVTTASLWLPTPREGDGWDSLHKRKNAAVVQRRLTEVKQMEMAAWLGPGVGERDGDLRVEEESGELRPVSEENAMAWRGLPNVGERRHSTDRAGQNRAFICAFGVTDSLGEPIRGQRLATRGRLASPTVQQIFQSQINPKSS